MRAFEICDDLKMCFVRRFFVRTKCCVCIKNFQNLLEKLRQQFYYSREIDCMPCPNLFPTLLFQNPLCCTIQTNFHRKKFHFENSAFPHHINSFHSNPIVINFSNLAKQGNWVNKIQNVYSKNKIYCIRNRIFIILLKNRSIVLFLYLFFLVLNFPNISTYVKKR